MNPLDLRPRSIGELLDVAFRLVTRNAKTLLPISLLFGLITSLIPTIVLLATVPDGAFVNSGNILIPDQAALDNYKLINLIVLGVGSFIGLVAFAPLYRAVVNGYMGRGESFTVCLRKGIGQTGPVIGLIVLTCLVVAVPVLFAVLAFAISDSVGVIGVVIAVIVGWVLLIRLSMALPALVTERIGPVGSLKRSFALTRTRGGSIFATILVGSIVIGILSGILTAVLAKAAAGSSVTSLIAGKQFAQGLVSAIVVTPFFVALITAIYFDLRVRNDGFDIEVLTSSLGDAGPPHIASPAAPAPHQAVLGDAATAFLQGRSGGMPSTDPYVGGPAPGAPPPQ